MDLVNRVMHRVIFPKGLRGLQQGAQTSAAAAAKKGAQTSAAAAAKEGAAETFKVARTRYYPKGDRFEMVGYPKVRGVQLPLRTVVTMGLGPTDKGLWAIWPESVKILGLRSEKVRKAVQTAMATDGRLRQAGDRFEVLMGGADQAFAVRKARHKKGGFILEGNPRVGKFTLPIPTAVTMASVPTADGSWAIRPERVTVFGISVKGLVEKVQAALKLDPRLAPEGDAFRIKMD